jgi:hypothetical protein
MIYLIGTQAIILAIAIYYKLALDKTNIEMLKLKQRIENIEVEVYSPMAERELPDGKKQQRITLCGVATMLVSKDKEKKSHIIKPR